MYYTWRNRWWRCCCDAGVRERDHISGYGGAYGRSVAREVVRGGGMKGERRSLMGREWSGRWMNKRKERKKSVGEKKKKKKSGKWKTGEKFVREDKKKCVCVLGGGGRTYSDVFENVAIEF